MRIPPVTSHPISVLIGALLLVVFGTPTVQAQKPADAIESAQSEWPGVQTDLLEVKRMSDNTVRVRWRWRNTTDKPVVFDPYGLLENFVYLLDPVNKKKHFVVLDANNSPIGSALLRSLTIPANQPITLWARFPAPPPSVGKITVVISNTLPFEDVTISK